MSGRLRRLIPAAGVAILFLLPLLPEIVGTRRLVFRDAQITHWPWRRVALSALGSGNVPFVNPAASAGQPLLANPNAALLYPTVLLEKILPAASAFNLHYLLQVLWAFLGAFVLARRLRASPGAAFFSGVAFAFSGMMLSYASAFLNSSAAAAWLPWCAAASLDLAGARTSREALRSGAAVALAFGLQLLAGEPALSLISALFCGFLVAGRMLGIVEGRGGPAMLAAGGVAAALAAAGLAAALLLPLRAVLALTYRGQHLYSQRAFGASPFALWRTVEWFFPRFNGDPGALAAGAHWQYALHAGDLVYIWCVTFGVLPLLVLLAGALRREFWTPAAVWLAAGGVVAMLFSLGFAFAPSRLLFSIPLARRLRYPIKLYLVTTLCVALLAGFGVDRLRQDRRRRRELLLLAAIALFYVAASLASGSGGPVEHAIRPHLANLAVAPERLLPAIRRTLRADAAVGLAAVAALALFLETRRRSPEAAGGRALGLVALVTALPWALPLFVSGDQKALSRPPAVLGTLRPPGPIHISPRVPEFNVLATGSAHPKLEPTVARLARIQIEELVPETGAPFGVRYAFDSDPDGSYGYYNRLCDEAMAASTPAEQARLLRIYGARWVLTDEARSLPLPIRTGLEIAGRRLILMEIPDPLPELRWVSRARRASSLSAALTMTRSEGFDPVREVVLPGSPDTASESSSTPARLSAAAVSADRASVRIEAPAAGHLVFSRTWFPAWKARVDGSSAPVLVANARDLAVRVPAGSHAVEFEYDRGPFRRGVSLQVAAFLAVLAAAVVSSRGQPNM